MAKVDAPPELFSRQQALKLRQLVHMRVWKGQPYISKWPRRRGRAQSQLQQAWINAFAERARRFKNPIPEALIEAQKLAAGTGWYYRDVLERASYGKLYTDNNERPVTTPTIHGFATADQALTSSVATPLPLAATTWDNNAFWDSGEPTKVTVKAAGLYIIGANVEYTTTFGANGQQLTLRLNGATQLAKDSRQGTTATPNLQALLTLWYFQSGDFFEVVVQRNNTGNRVILRNVFAVAITPEALI